MDPRGVHLLLECRGCPPALLDDCDGLEAGLRALAARLPARVINAAFHRFAPHGVTGVLLLEESHLSIHTWPERGYAAVDVYSCGLKELARVPSLFRDLLAAERVDHLEIERGHLEAACALRVLGRST